MKKIRVYCDTSVFGGVYDQEFDEVSAKFFREIEKGHFTLVTSAVVDAEIEAAPKKVRSLFEKFLAISEVVKVTDKVLRLRDAYIEEGIVSANCSDDALHVALASVSNCDLIVSWNFKHIVHFEKIPLYNAVNTLNGYLPIKIFSPLEVVKYEN